MSGKITAATTDAEIEAFADEYGKVLTTRGLPFNRQVLIESMKERREHVRKMIEQKEASHQ